jgi:hypothetical protein
MRGQAGPAARRRRPRRHSRARRGIGPPARALTRTRRGPKIRVILSHGSPGRKPRVPQPGETPVGRPGPPGRRLCARGLPVTVGAGPGPGRRPSLTNKKTSPCVLPLTESCASALWRCNSVLQCSFRLLSESTSSESRAITETRPGRHPGRHNPARMGSD